ncbi:hypothetical protein Tco_1418657 [Tanacetum coccineum]
MTGGPGRRLTCAVYLGGVNSENATWHHLVVTTWPSNDYGRQNGTGGRLAGAAGPNKNDTWHWVCQYDYSKRHAGAIMEALEECKMTKLNPRSTISFVGYLKWTKIPQTTNAIKAPARRQQVWLRIKARRHEWQRQAADDLAVQAVSLRTQALGAEHRIVHIGDTEMASKTTRSTPVTTTTDPTTTTTTTVTNAQLQAMINEGVSAALAARDATRNGTDSILSSGKGSGDLNSF